MSILTFDPKTDWNYFINQSVIMSLVVAFTCYIIGSPNKLDTIYIDDVMYQLTAELLPLTCYKK